MERRGREEEEEGDEDVPVAVQEDGMRGKKGLKSGIAVWWERKSCSSGLMNAFHQTIREEQMAGESMDQKVLLLLTDSSHSPEKGLLRDEILPPPASLFTRITCAVYHAPQTCVSECRDE